MAFPVKEDGTLGPGRVFYDATRFTMKLKGLPDGMKIDRQGNLFGRPRRDQRLFARRHAAGPDQSRRARLQLRLWRRRLRAVRYGQSLSLPDQDEHEGRSAVGLRANPASHFGFSPESRFIRYD